jgi:hypothetical protein
MHHSSPNGQLQLWVICRRSKLYHTNFRFGSEAEISHSKLLSSAVGRKAAIKQGQNAMPFISAIDQERSWL